MCMAKAPKVSQTVTPPPAEAPQPLASPYGEEQPMGLSQLRFGSKNNLRLRKQAAPGAGGSTGGSSGSSSGSSSGGSGSGGGAGGGGSNPIKRPQGLQL
jgi:hypothetical protein